MSGLYIPSMKKPTNCHDCPLVDTLENCPCREMPDKDFWDSFILSMTVHEKCPLIPVPDHGRLIDAYFIVKRLRKQIQEVGEDTELANRDREFISVIGAVSAIIPADKEGET